MSTVRDMVLIIKDISNIVADILHLHLSQITATYKKIMTELLSWLLLVLLSILLAIGGLIFVIYGTHVYLSRMIGEVSSSMLLGGIIIFLSVIIFLFAGKKIK